MASITLDQELERLKHSYDFGIVPGSATVFHKDEMHNLGKLDLTLLEGVMVVIQVSDEGYTVKKYISSKVNTDIT
jgi:hypothetical protein